MSKGEKAWLNKNFSSDVSETENPIVVPFAHPVPVTVLMTIMNLNVGFADFHQLPSENNNIKST